MADYKLNKKEVARMHDFVRVGRDHCEKKFVKETERFKDLYSCIYFKEADKSERIGVPETFAAVRIMHAATFNRRPRFLAVPAKKESVKDARVAQAYANNTWRRIRVQEEVELVNLDRLILGKAFTKTGWRYEGRIVEDKQRFLERLKSYFIEEDEVEDVVEDVPLVDEPFVERVSPYNLWVPPDATCLEDAAFVVHHLIKPLKSVKANPNYAHTAELKASSALDKDFTENVKESKEKDYLQRLSIYEVYDRETGLVVTLAQGSDRPLRIMPFPFEYGGWHPFDELDDYKLPGEFYGFGEPHVIEAQQNERNLVRTQQVQLRKKQGRFLMAEKGAIEDTEKAKFLTGRDGTIIEVNAFDKVREFKFGELSRDLEGYDEMIKDDIRLALGIPDFQRASQEGAVKSATEMGQLGSAAEARPKEKAQQLEELLARVMAKILGLARQFLDEPQMVRITDEPGIPEFLEYDAGADSGSYDIIVEIGSTSARNEAADKQQAMELFDKFIGNPDVNPRELAVQVFRAFGWDQNDKLLIPESKKEPEPAADPKLILNIDSRTLTNEQIVQLLAQCNIELEPKQQGAQTSDEGVADVRGDAEVEAAKIEAQANLAQEQQRGQFQLIQSQTEPKAEGE